MPENPQYDKTIRIELDSTLPDIEENGNEQRFEFDMDDLKQHFENILRDESIYYPVAYRFSRELGRGRQGVVFQGSRHGARGCVIQHAIKIFDPSNYTSAMRYWSDMGRIAHQISRMQALNSPHLALREVYEEYNGIGYCQMEVVDGINLDDMLNPDMIQTAKHNSSNRAWDRISDVVFRFEDSRISVQPGVALYILRQALRGLEVLHSQGFLHSDVKPANLMISRSGFIKLIDFGRATRIREKSNILFGTPSFMSPEAHRREPCDVQSDLFSVGILALYLLTGSIPKELRQGSEEDILHAKMELSSRLPEILPDHVLMNDQFVVLLHRFLNPNPWERFSSAKDAESGSKGLRLVHKQLTFTGQDSEYDRELQFYLNILLSSNKPLNENF